MITEPEVVALLTLAAIVTRLLMTEGVMRPWTETTPVDAIADLQASVNPLPQWTEFRSRSLGDVLEVDLIYGVAVTRFISRRKGEWAEWRYG